MDHYDPEKTARVWQRVQGIDSFVPPQTPLPRDRTIEELIAGELADAAAFQRLARRYYGPERARLLQMARQEQAHAVFLRSLQTRRPR